MRSWIKTKLKIYYLAPKRHIIEQVILLLESNMPYNIISKTLKLPYETLDEFTESVYFKQKSTFNKLKEMFSQHQLLVLFTELSNFMQLITNTLIKKSLYPLS